jgi:hypothetical protein
MIDGCFLKCHGRVLSQLIGADKVIRVDALKLYRKYQDVFAIEDVPEEERKTVARQVANRIIEMLAPQDSMAH